jgi:hypothetical protein
MNSPDDFPLDSFGIEQTPPRVDSFFRQSRQVADLASAVMALDHSDPIKPQPDSWNKIVGKISSRTPIARSQRAFAWSGWAAATVAMVLLIQKTTNHPHYESTASKSVGIPLASSPSEKALSHENIDVSRPPPDAISDHDRQTSHHVAKETAQIHEQQRSLIQEIETLRKQIAVLASRDVERLVPQHGISWPIIMKLTVPGTNPSDAVVDDSLLHSILQFDMKDARGVVAQTPLRADATLSQPPLNPTLPSAVPIYDPARDAGLLVISNLNKPKNDQAYHLWVQSDESPQPVLVGTLPDHIAASESFDFKLGSVGIMPDQFLVTQDSRELPKSPNSENTILLGPTKKP